MAPGDAPGLVGDDWGISVFPAFGVLLVLDHLHELPVVGQVVLLDHEAIPLGVEPLGLHGDDDLGVDAARHLLGAAAIDDEDQHGVARELVAGWQGRGGGERHRLGQARDDRGRAVLREAGARDRGPLALSRVDVDLLVGLEGPAADAEGLARLGHLAAHVGHLKHGRVGAQVAEVEREAPCVVGARQHAYLDGVA